MRDYWAVFGVLVGWFLAFYLLDLVRYSRLPPPGQQQAGPAKVRARPADPHCLADHHFFYWGLAAAGGSVACRGMRSVGCMAAAAVAWRAWTPHRLCGDVVHGAAADRMSTGRCVGGLEHVATKG